MSAKVGKNIASSMLANVLLALLALIVTPLQVSYLGIEAYGVIGFVATLQVALLALDLGLSSTLSREIAFDTSDGKRESYDLIRTSLTFYWCVAIVIGATLWFSARPFATYWLNSRSLTVTELTDAMQVAAIALAVRWPISAYSGILMGLQQITAINFVRVATLTMRLAGSIAILAIFGTMVSFLTWMAVSSVLEVIVYRLVYRRFLRGVPLRPTFALAAIKRVWRFAISMNLLAVLSVLITQIDRVVISKTKPLPDLGFYILAYSAASFIALLTSAVTTAVMPWFAEAHASGRPDRLRENFYTAMWIMLLVAGPPCGALIFFSRSLLELWVGSSMLNDQTVYAASVLASAFWVSAIVAIAYNVAVALAQPRLPMIIALILSVPYVLLVYYLVDRLGSVGGAWAWLCLQVCNALVLLPAILKRQLNLPSAEFATKCVGPVGLLLVATFGGGRAIAYGVFDDGAFAQIILLACAVPAFILVGWHISPLRIKSNRHETFGVRTG